MSTSQYTEGLRVQVLQCGHDFHGTVTRNDPDNFLVFVAEDGADAVWGMPTCNVYPLEVAQ